MEKKRIPIIYSGPKPKVNEKGVNLDLATILVWLSIPDFAREVKKDDDGGDKDFLRAEGDWKKKTHVVFWAKAHGFEDGALFVVSIQETLDELIARLEGPRPTDLPLVVERDHPYQVYYED